MSADCQARYGFIFSLERLLTKPALPGRARDAPNVLFWEAEIVLTYGSIMPQTDSLTQLESEAERQSE